MEPRSNEAHSAPEIVQLSASAVGTVRIAPPSFLERWGFLFLAFFGGWIIVVGTILLVFFLTHQPAAPNLTGLSSEGVRDALSSYKLLEDQWRESLTYIFDLLITKTALPLVTLLLGYLFGKAREASE